MSSYIKVMVIVSLLILTIAGVGFKYSVDKTVSLMQTSLDTKTKDAASLIALSLNGVDIESEIELVESLVRGAYNLGSFEEVTLYGRPRGDNQNLKMQNKKDIGKDLFKNVFFELKASESFENITLDGEVQGKVLVKGDRGEAFMGLNDAVSTLLTLFLILAFGSIVILAVIFKTAMKSEK